MDERHGRLKLPLLKASERLPPQPLTKMIQLMTVGTGVITVSSRMTPDDRSLQQRSVPSKQVKCKEDERCWVVSP